MHKVQANSTLLGQCYSCWLAYHWNEKMQTSVQDPTKLAKPATYIALQCSAPISTRSILRTRRCVCVCVCCKQTVRVHVHWLCAQLQGQAVLAAQQTIAAAEVRKSIFCCMPLLFITAIVDAAPAAAGKQLALLTVQLQRQFSQAPPCSGNSRIQHKQAAP